MERNTQTTIKNLKPGDRFYKVTDKKKEVWQKVVCEVKVTKYQTYSNFAKRDIDQSSQAFKSETEIIFLRTNIPQTQS